MNYLNGLLNKCGAPRPWKLKCINGHWTVLDANGFAVCDCGSYGDNKFPDPAGKLIVAAVNKAQEKTF